MDELEHVDPQDPSLTNSPTGGKQDDEALESAAALRGEACYWNDKKYSDGASVCDNKIRYKCWNGRWVEVGQC